MLLAIALDLASNALDVEVLASAIGEVARGSEDPHTDFCSALARRVRDDFAKCIATAAGRDLEPSESYVALMTFRKYAHLFRLHDGVDIGPGGRATELDYLRHNADLDGPVSVELQHELRGQHRPISWVTRSSAVDHILGPPRPPQLQAVALELIEQLGLPWPAGVEHDVFLLRYPADFNWAVRVGRPNSFCECWDAPGLFVPAATSDGWGQTCGRTRSDHPGVPERVHEPIAVDSAHTRFELAFVASVTLQGSDPAIAAAEAARRWAVHTGGLDDRVSPR